LFVFGEHLLILSVLMLVGPLRVDEPLRSASFIARAVFAAVVLQVVLHYLDLYDVRTLADRRRVLTAVFRALGVTSLILGTVYFMLPNLSVGRGVFVLASIPIIGAVFAWRLVFEWLSVQGGPTERLLILGTNPAAAKLAQELIERRSELGIEVVGFVASDPAQLEVPILKSRVIGLIRDIPVIVRERRVDRVVVSLHDARGMLNMDELVEMKVHQGVRFDHLASVYEEYTGKIAVENLRPSWVIFGAGFRKAPWLAAAKRASDVALASVALMIAAPLMALAALAVRYSSPGPVIYRQTRVGKDEQPIVVMKFRSMRADAEATTGAVWAVEGDSRVTPVGRFLRRSRIDELPQLWNVLRGDMSFVGPRPERPEFVAELSRQIRFYEQRHVIRPGLTGWAQVRHRYGASVEDAQEKLQYDLYYIKQMSLAFDIFIIAETVKTVLMRRGS